MAFLYDVPPDAPTGVRMTRNWIITASLVVIAICTAGAALMYLRDILTPLFIAIFLYFLIQPLIQRLFQWRLPRWMLYALLIIIPLLVVLLTVWVVDSNVREFAAKLPDYQTRLKTMVGDVIQWSREWEDVFTRDANPADASVSPEETPPADSPAKETPRAETVPDNRLYSINEFFDVSRKSLVESALNVTLKIVEVSVLVVFYLLFLFIEARKFHGRVRSGFEKETAERILGVVQTIDDSVRQYLWIKTGVSFGLGATTTILCWLFGLDFALLWGVLMFLANYITYVGSIFALAPPIAIAFVQFDSPIAAAVLTTLLVLNRLFWIDYAEIKFSGEHLDVSPLLLLISIALLGWIWGVVGMLLAVPLVTSTKIVLSHFDNTRHIAKLMSDD